MIEFCQASFDNDFNANAMLQEQFERMADTVLNEAKWLPAEARQTIENWVEAYKTGRDNFKKNVDVSYRKIQEVVID